MKDAERTWILTGAPMKDIVFRINLELFHLVFIKEMDHIATDWS